MVQGFSAFASPQSAYLQQCAGSLGLPDIDARGRGWGLHEEYLKTGRDNEEFVFMCYTLPLSEKNLRRINVT